VHHRVAIGLGSADQEGTGAHGSLSALSTVSA